jgi:N-methylhydantoinase A
MVNVHVDVVGQREPPTALARDDREADTEQSPPDEAISGHRSVTFSEHTRQTPVYERAALSAGHTFAGPAIVEEPQSTTVVFPDQTARVDPGLNLIITEGES